MSQDYIARTGQRSGQRSNMSANWRDKSATVDTVDQLQALQFAQQQQQQQQYSMRQQGLYHAQQNQMAIQLEAMRIQNAELQERLQASMQVQNKMDTAYKRRSGFVTAYNSVENTFSPDDSLDAYEPLDTSNTRRGALESLQRASKNRLSCEIPSGEAETGQKTRNRLSFTGGEGLAERALARKALAVTTPPATQTQFNFSSNSTSSSERGHHRSTSSMSSAASEVLSEARKKIVSPSGGPTLVLSSPGEAFPSPTLGKSTRSARLAITTDKPVDASESSSGSNTPSSETSEVLSFESTTSASTHRAAQAKADQRVSLNPSAPSFTPGHNAKPSFDGKVTPPMAFAPRHTKTGSWTAFSPPSLAAALLASTSPGPRSFSPPVGNSPLVTVIRQPRGPANDEDLPTLNFAGRRRRLNFSSIKSRLRSAQPSPCTSPTAQTTFGF